MSRFSDEQQSRTFAPVSDDEDIFGVHSRSTTSGPAQTGMSWNDVAAQAFRSFGEGVSSSSAERNRFVEMLYHPVFILCALLVVLFVIYLYARKKRLDYIRQQKRRKNQ